MGEISSALRSGDYMNLVVDVEELLEAIENRFGDMDDECGCYVNGQWMSPKDFAQMVVNCSRYDYEMEG